MNRSKLEYLLKELPREQENKIVREMDPEGDYLIFGKIVCQYLTDPDTTNERILNRIPGYPNPAKVEAYKNRFRLQYARINDLCVGYGIEPFFPDPTDIKQSEAIRRDLVAQVPEAYLNNFFGVNSFYDFIPPKYRPEPK